MRLFLLPPQISEYPLRDLDHYRALQSSAAELRVLVGPSLEGQEEGGEESPLPHPLVEFSSNFFFF